MVLTTKVLPRRLFEVRWSCAASPHSSPPILWPRRKAARSRHGSRSRQVDAASLNVLLQEWMEWMVHVSDTLLWWSSTIWTRPATRCMFLQRARRSVSMYRKCTWNVSEWPHARVTACRGASLRMQRKPVAPAPLRWREARRQAFQVAVLSYCTTQSRTGFGLRAG